MNIEGLKYLLATREAEIDLPFIKHCFFRALYIFGRGFEAIVSCSTCFVENRVKPRSKAL